MANLGFDIFARDRNASRNIDKVGQAADRSGKKFGNLNARTKHMSAGMRVSFGAVATAMGAIAGISVFKNFIDEASEARKVGRLTDAVIKSTGGAANVTAKHVAKLAESMSNKVAVDDEAIQASQNLLLTFTGVRNEVGLGNKIFDRASMAVVDMTAAMNNGVVTQQKLKGVTIQVGKALNDPIKGITALARAGVSFTEKQKKQIKSLVESGDKLKAQKIILRELGKEFGGAAAASKDPMQQLTVVLDNASEKIGTALLPYIDKAANWLGKHLPGAIDKAVKWFEGDLVPAIKDTAAWFRRNADTVETVGKLLVSVFVVSKITAGIRGMGKALGLVNTGLLAVPASAKGASAALGSAGIAGAAGTLGGKLGGVLKRLGLIGAAFYAIENPGKIVAGVGVIGEAFDGLTGLITGNETAVKNAGDNIRNHLVNIFGEETTNSILAVSETAQEQIREVQRLVKQKWVLELQGDIKDLDKKIKQGEKEIKDVPEWKKTLFQGEIKHLKEKRRQAQQEIDKLRGKTVTIKLNAPGFINDLIKGNLKGGDTFDPTPGFGGGGGFAAGGKLPGPKSNVDNHLRPMATGEFVVRASRVTPQTEPLLDAINSGRDIGLAKGGVVTRAKFSGSPGLVPQMTTHAQLIGGAIGQIVSVVKKVASSMLGGGRLGGALAFAKSQAGKPYIWGGVGPHGYDCSGFMSALVNVARGRGPHSRLGSTGTFPWGGFARGPGRFMIGSQAAGGIGGSLVGHMAGTLLGTNVESRGGDGVVVGRRARGARSGLFGGNVWHLKGYARGGLVGDPPFDTLDPRGMHYARMDRGGILKPGRTIVDNHTGGNETVFPGGPKEFGEAVAEALYRKFAERGRILAAVDVGRESNLLARGF